MSRLLLVDDNPSIHRIAESLLAPTDVEVVCVDTAAEALERIGRGERFDVALLDTAMPGMDGWALLARLRDMEVTARMPIAMMAGVLDPVEPARLAQAPIQGFLKKPIELRELADRVKALLATPVAGAAAPAPPPAPVFDHPPVSEPVPETARTAELALPAFPSPAAVPAALEAAPMAAHSAPVAVLPVEDDLLVLTAEDLWPEDVAPAPAAPAAPIALALPEPVAAPAPAPEVRLELEDLDLDSLHGLEAGVLPVPEPPVALPPIHTLEVPPVAEPLTDLNLPALAGVEGLEDLGAGFDLPPLPEPVAEVEAVPPPVAWAPPPAAALEPTLPVAPPALAVPFAEPPAAPAPEPAPAAPAFAAPVMPPAPPMAAAPMESAQASAAAGQVPAAPGQASPTPEQVQAILADPALMDALVKALVSRMGDQVLREIAWEVMPELAGRLQR